jgi:hypothetical protein
MNLITLLLIVPKLRMSGAILLLPHIFIVWTGIILALAKQLTDRKVKARSVP